MNVNSIQHNEQTLVLEFSGKLDFQARQAYQQAVNQAEAMSPKYVIFDLTGVSYIDSAGLGLLTLTSKKLAGEGIKVGLTNPQNSVKQILELTNMEKMYPIYESTDTASQALKSMPSSS